jgi:hypothetical protein
MSQPKCRRCRKQTYEALTVEGEEDCLRPLPFCESCRHEMLREGVIPRIAADLDASVAAGS